MFEVNNVKVHLHAPTFDVGKRLTPRSIISTDKYNQGGYCDIYAEHKLQWLWSTL